jgi:anaerobic magnesium-protoporphyrin IX monomethyl ester cyclase
MKEFKKFLYLYVKEIKGMTTKDCLLIIPPFQSGTGSILKSFKYSMPPLGLLSIAAWLRQNDIGVSLLDFTIEDTTKYSAEDILLNHVKEYGTPQWIGISVCTPVAYNAYNIADICKKLFANTKVVLGGPHITVLGSEVFNECKSADYLITGEGEYTLCNLIKNKSISANNLLIRGDHTDRTVLPENTVDLATLPMPAYDLLKFDKYIPPPASLNSKHPGIGIITTRGCPFTCTFCTKISGSKLRLIPVSKVIEQLKYLKSTFKIKQFHFYDDTISCNRKYILELCETIIEENLNIHWSAFARVDTVDEEILMMMKKAGCFIIMYGVESMDEEILLSVKKGITVPQIKAALIQTRKAGIESRISVIIGNPKDTPETMHKTQKELLKLKTDFLQVFIAIPMPGSQFYKEAKAENRVLSENWEDYNLSKVLYRHPVFTEKQLFKIQRQYYLSFYLRPGIVFRHISKIRSWNAVRNIFNGFLGFLKIISA